MNIFSGLILPLIAYLVKNVEMIPSPVDFALHYMYNMCVV